MRPRTSLQRSNALLHFDSSKPSWVKVAFLTFDAAINGSLTPFKHFRTGNRWLSASHSSFKGAGLLVALAELAACLLEIWTTGAADADERLVKDRLSSKPWRIWLADVWCICCKDATEASVAGWAFFFKWSWDESSCQETNFPPPSNLHHTPSWYDKIKINPKDMQLQLHCYTNELGFKVFRDDITSSKKKLQQHKQPERKKQHT